MERSEVVVTDIAMPFGSMVVFMVKWAIAAVPALLILSALTGLVSFLFIGFFASLAQSLGM